MARGDVIFYRPANADSIEDLAQRDLDEFPVLAAYAQTIPYAPGAFMPWHHVALSISDDDSRVIGFAEREYQPGEQPVSGQLANAVLKETDGAPAAGLTTDALRPPEGIVDALVAESQEQKSTVYSAAGLMPFALITAAWMIPNELPARDRLRTMAFGASAVARRTEPQAESCTTAIAKAVIATQGGLELTFTEPPIPLSSATAQGFAASDQVRIIRALIPRLDEALRDLFETSLLGSRLDGDVVTRLRNGVRPLPQGRLASMGDALVGAQDEIVDREKLEKALGGVIRDHGRVLFGLDVGTDPLEAPGDDTTFPRYTGTLVGGMEVFAPGTDFEAEGQARAQPLQLQSEDYLISPAVLWDALIAADFQRV